MADSNSCLYGNLEPYEYEPGLILLGRIYLRDVVNSVKTFPLETGDVVIATYPKAGTTWMQEVMSRIFLQNDPEAVKVKISERVPYMEEKRTFPGAISGLDMVSKLPPPRIMKTHLPSHFYQKQLADSKAKFIVVMRNVKDSLVSYYHFHRALFRYKGTWDDFFETFKTKQLLMGDWLDYNLGWWALKRHPNVLIVKYEDMKKNRREVIQKAAEFCEKGVSEETLDDVAAATSFEEMRDNPATNFRDNPGIDSDISPFIRKGVVGDWKEYFSDDQNDFVEERYLKEAAKKGLYFEYTL